MKKALFLKIGNSQMTIFPGQKSWPSSSLGVRLLKKYLDPHSEIHFISVVPKISQKIKSSFKNAHEWKTKDIPLSLAYRKGLGVDRAFNLLGAHGKFSGEKFVVLDFGTAITIDFFDGKKHLGGFIVAGANSLLKILFLSTALLPNLEDQNEWQKLEKAKPGKDTISSIREGRKLFLKGLIRAAEELAQSLFKTSNFRMVLTGGKVEKISYGSASARHLSKVPLLQLHGLKYLIDANSGLRRTSRRTQKSSRS